MNGIRRTLSFRKKKKKQEISDGAKPQQWLEDEAKIKEGCCSFHVRYLGNIEVYESRGMQVCEEAIRALRKSKKKPQKAILYVSGDALRVSDDISQHLIVDQTIEKVSFCAPDRNHDKGFAYICRDGATRRWMCHAFLAVKESGERLSHAVGCAFAICLEKKQKRERDALQLASSDERPFVRVGSVRPVSLAERLIDPQSAITPAPPAKSGDADHSPASLTVNSNSIATYSPTSSSVSGAIARPRPSASMIERQGSLRVFPKLQDASPFKRDLSLRLTDLPSNFQRINRAVNGHTIPEENGVESEQPVQYNSFPVNTPSQPSPVTHTVGQHELPPRVQSATPTNSFPTVAPVAFSAAANFVDPFSAAPFSPGVVPPGIPQSSASDEVKALSQLSVSSPPTAPNPPHSVATHIVSSTSPIPTPPVANDVSVPYTSTTLSGWPPVSTFPAAAYPQLHAQAPYVRFNHPLHVAHVPATNPYAVAAYSRFQTPWLPSPGLPTQDWCPPLPSLLPPEPARFADPFDVGWAERATASLVPTVANHHHQHKSGNPFVSTSESNGTT